MVATTPEQQAVVDWVANGRGNALVSSVAGSGKSTLITQCANQIDLNQKVLILSFNKKIADEMRAKLRTRIPNRFPGGADDWKLTQAATLNGIGKRLMVNHFKYGLRNPRDIKENNEKLNDIISNLTDELFDRRNGRYIKQLDAYRSSPLFPLGTPPVKPKRKPCFNTVTNLIRLSRANLYTPSPGRVQELREIIGFYGIEINSSLDLEWAAESLERINNESIARFNESYQITLDEQVYMPWVFNMRDPFPWDWIFVDECQDLSPLRIDLLRRLSKPSTRFIFVGDNDQSIYGWTGADPRCFYRISKEFQPSCFSLTATFRCSHAVTDLAKKYVPSITAFESNLKGEVKKFPHGGSLPELNSGDAILSRLKSGLIRIATKLIREQKKFQGFEELLDEKMLEQLQRYYEEQSDSLPISQRLTRVAVVIEDDIDSNGCSSDKVELYDLAVALKDLSDAFPFVRDFAGLRDQLYIVCKGTNDGPVLSTIHKQKGAEFNDVLIVDFSLMPMVWPGQQEWEFQQEINLIYVAITRAKDKLYLYDLVLPPKNGFNLGLATRQRVVNSEEVKAASDKLLKACSSQGFVEKAAREAVPLYMWESSIARFVAGHQFQYGARIFQVISREGNIIIAMNLSTFHAKVFAIFPRERVAGAPNEIVITSLEDLLQVCPDPTNPPKGIFVAPTENDQNTIRNEWLRLCKLWHPDVNPSPVAAEIMMYINAMYAKSKLIA
jgi:superfamily I DNA/RNA helicase